MTVTTTDARTVPVLAGDHDSPYLYYPLPPERWSELADLVGMSWGEDYIAQIPSPDAAIAIVAENAAAGTLHGFAFLMFAAHFDCSGIVPSHSGVSMSGLMSAAESILPSGSVFYSLVPDSGAARATAIRQGMSEIPEHRLFRKEVG